jgi:predicted esterase
MLLLSCFTLGEPPRPIPANLEVPWFWGHGDRDTVVRLAQAKEAVTALEKVCTRTLPDRSYPLASSCNACASPSPSSLQGGR